MALLIPALISTVFLMYKMFLNKESEKRIMAKLEDMDKKLGKLDSMETLLKEILNELRGIRKRL